MADEKTQNLQELRQQLQAWAQDYGHAQDTYLVGLDAALESNSELEFWQTIDPLDYLPKYVSARGSNLLKIARFLAGIRNIIIFVPVALTWAAVSEATRAFNEFVLQNTGTPANFLQFWQDGYGILNKFWSIGSVAQIDFVIVALVILLTAVVAVMQAQGQSNLSRDNKQFASSRSTLALQIKATLHDFRPVTGGAVSVEVAKSVKALKAALANGQSIEKPYARLSKNVSDAATQVKSSTTTLKTQLAGLQREIVKAEKKLGK